MTQTIVSNLNKRIDTTVQKFGVSKIILKKFILNFSGFVTMKTFTKLQKICIPNKFSFKLYTQ